MSPPGEDVTMHVGDVQAKIKSDKENSAPRRSDAINMSQSQPTKTTFTFALKPMSTPPFVHSMTCNEGINFVIDLNQTGPSFAQVLESNIRRSVEMYDFESFHGEIQFLQTKQNNLLELSGMDMPMTLKENTTFPHSSRDNAIEKHDPKSSEALEIPLMQICGSDSQKKRTSASSCNDSVHAMATENVAGTSFSEVNNNQFSIRTFAEEMCGRNNNQKAPIEMENCSDKASKGRKQGKGYLKRYNKKDGGVQTRSDKKVRFKECSSQEVHDPKEKSSGNIEK